MKKFIALLLISFVAFACGSDSNKSTKSDVNHTEIKAEILKLNDEFDHIFVNEYNRESLSAIAEKITNKTDLLTDSDMKDSSLAKIYFIAGEVSMKIFDGDKAIKYFTKLSNEFPEDEQADKAEYFIGYTYENVIQDLEKAKEVYKNLYRTKPNSDWGENAKSQVKFLNNMSPMQNKAQNEENIEEETSEE